MYDKYKLVSWSVATLLLISIIFVLTISYISHCSDMNGMVYDVNTIMVGDYTVEMDITN